MPISAEQWRAAVGAANASRRPCQPKHRLQPWDVFMLIITSLLVSTLLPGGGWRGIGSRREYWMVNMVGGGQRCWNGLQHDTALLYRPGLSELVRFVWQWPDKSFRHTKILLSVTKFMFYMQTAHISVH